MRLSVGSPGRFTTVQDLGRYGCRSRGVPVAGAMDGPALRLGNILLGNDEGAAALEITVLGPVLRGEEGEGCVVVTGADAGVTCNGAALDTWRVHRVAAGDTLAFAALARVADLPSRTAHERERPMASELQVAHDDQLDEMTVV